MPIFNNSQIKLQEGIYKLCGFYKYQKTLNLSNIKSKIYQKNYISFYRLRRDKNWIKQYFKILDNYYKKNQSGNNYCFKDVLQDLYNVQSKSRNGKYQSKIEMSFASKLLHTVNPDFPIWDSQVRKKLGINNTIKTINDGATAYDDLCKRYALMKKDPQFKTFVFNFDSLFPKFAWISETKKVDFYLWM
jgi:hypothetical protein